MRKKIGFILFLVVIIIGVLLYFSLNRKELSNDTLNNLISGVYLSDLYNEYGVNELFINDNNNLNGLSKEFKVSVASKNVNYTTKVIDDKPKKVYDGLKVKEAYEKLFGKKTYEHSKGIYKCGVIAYDYDEKSGNYIENDVEVDCNDKEYHLEVLDSSLEKENVKIKVGFYYFKKSGSSMYLVDATNDKVVGINDHEEYSYVNSNLDNLNHYEFTFNKNDTGYIFNSISKVHDGKPISINTEKVTKSDNRFLDKNLEGSGINYYDPIKDGRVLYDGLTGVYYFNSYFNVVRSGDNVVLEINGKEKSYDVADSYVTVYSFNNYLIVGHVKHNKVDTTIYDNKYNVILEFTYDTEAGLYFSNENIYYGIASCDGPSMYGDLAVYRFGLNDYKNEFLFYIDHVGGWVC